MITLIRAPSHLLLCLILISALLLPLAQTLGLNVFYLDLTSRFMIFAIAAVGLNLILGYGGLISLGHAVYLLIGAYSVAIPNYFEIDNGWLHLVLALASGGLFALITGAISLRTKGAGFIMITLAFAQMVYFLFVSLETLGGSDGIYINLTSNFQWFNLEATLPLYYSAFLVLCGSLWLVQRLNRARFGYALAGCRLNARRMRSLGYSPYKILLGSYVIAGMITSLAGLLLANFVQFVTPEMMDWFQSAELIFMVALGGAATLAGPVLGAFSFVLLEHVLSEWSLYWHFFFGLFLIAIAIFSKGGLAVLIDRLFKRAKNA